MNKIMKLFPVALAAVALASCSNDNDLFGNDGEIQLKSNELLVTVENLDETRAGFVEKEIDSKLKRTTVFNEGDVLKIYDDTNDWRPQAWTFAGTTDEQYTNATGAAQGGEGSTAIFQAPADVPNKYDKGYGIYPYSFRDPVSGDDKRFGEFTDEARLSMKFDFDMLKVMNVSAGRNIDALPTTSDYKGGAACYAPVPMWGVAASQKMTLKYLTAFLRIDVTKVKAAQGKDALKNPTDAKWLLIRSNQALTGTFTANGIKPDDATEGLKVKAPVLANADAPTVPTAALNAYPKTGADGNTDILVNIGQCGGDLVIYIPIAAGPDAEHKINHNFQVLLSNDVPNADATINFEAAGVTQIANSWATPVAKSVYRGQTYSIIDDSRNVNTSAHTPYDLTKAIVDADKEAMRDFTITFANDIKVKNDDASTQNFYLDLTFNKYGEEGYNSEYVLKHNVTINVNFVKDASAIAATRLFVKTPANGKDITLNVGEGNTLDQIYVKDGELNSKLVLKRSKAEQFKEIYIGKNNANLVTLKAGAKQVYSSSNFTISTPSATNGEDNVDVLTLANGLTKLTIEKGRISTVNFSSVDKIGDNVEVYTTGEVGINKVDYTNVPRTEVGGKFTDTWNVAYNSVWDGSTTTVFPVTQLVSQGATINNAIVTASQLAAMTGAEDFTVAGTFDLNKKTWTSLTGLTKNVSGAEFFRCSDADKAAITGKAVIKNLKGANGLLASWNPSAADKAISNFKFGGENKVTATTNVATALLVGSVAPNGVVATINDIEFAGTSNVIDNGAGVTLNKGTGLLAGYVDTKTGAAGSELDVKDILVTKGTVGLADQGATAALAAVIGKFEGTTGVKPLILANVKVNSGVTVTGFKNIGGIIGEITVGKVIFAAKRANGDVLVESSANHADLDELNGSAATLSSYTITGAPYSQMLPTYGQFFGTALATGDADITIMGNIERLDPFTSATTDPTQWGYYLADKNGEYFGWKIYRKYNEIGHCGYATATVDGNNVVQPAAGFGYIVNNRVNNSDHKYNTVKYLYPSVSGSAPIDDAIGTPYVRYTGYVKKPY